LQNGKVGEEGFRFLEEKNYGKGWWNLTKKKREDDEKWRKLGVDSSLLNRMDMQSNG